MNMAGSELLVPFCRQLFWSILWVAKADLGVLGLDLVLRSAQLNLGANSEPKVETAVAWEQAWIGFKGIHEKGSCFLSYT